MVEANIFLFKRDKQDVKKSSLIEIEVSPKLNFGSLVGLSSFW
jgi:hypothetical protein